MKASVGIHVGIVKAIAGIGNESFNPHYLTASAKVQY
jgi:hypothetical protein